MFDSEWFGGEVIDREGEQQRETESEGGKQGGRKEGDVSVSV